MGSYGGSQIGLTLAEIELALAMWSDLDELIVAKINEQERIITSLIERGKHVFTQVNVWSNDTGDGELVTMLEIPTRYQYYYHDGHFYLYQGMVNTGTGAPQGQSPRVVHLLEGMKLQDLLRENDFIATITKAIQQQLGNEE